MGVIERSGNRGESRGAGGGLSLLVLLTISVQLVVGAESALASVGTLGGERVCLRRLPTEVVRVIRDLVERRETEGEATRVASGITGEASPSVSTPESVPGPVAPLGVWLLDLPPPTLA